MFGLTAAAPRGHHRHVAELGDLSYEYEWEGRAESKPGTSYISTKWLRLKALQYRFMPIILYWTAIYH